MQPNIALQLRLEQKPKRWDENYIRQWRLRSVGCLASHTELSVAVQSRLQIYGRG